MANGWAFSIPTNVMRTRECLSKRGAGEDEYSPVEGGVRKIELNEWNVHINVRISTKLNERSHGKHFSLEWTVWPWKIEWGNRVLEGEMRGRMYKAQRCCFSSLVSVTRGDIAYWSKLMSSATDNEGKMTTMVRIMDKEVEYPLDDLDR
jgi:hypothetical protein